MQQKTKFPNPTSKQSSCPQCCSGTNRGRDTFLQNEVLKSVLAYDEEAQAGRTVSTKIHEVKNLPFTTDTKINVSEISKQ